MNSLSGRSRPERESGRPGWGLALGLAAVFMMVLALPFALVPPGWYWLPLPFVLLFVLPPLESLLLAPLYTLTGRFHYYSPFLFSTRAGDTYDLHVGTLFDYVRGLRWSDRGARARRIVVVAMLRGLLRLCDEIEDGSVARDARISATSYFFSDRSAARLGFTEEPAAGKQVLNLITASLSVALRLSFTQGRLRWPDLRHVRGITTTGARLLDHRTEIRRMLARIERARRSGLLTVRSS